MILVFPSRAALGLIFAAAGLTACAAHAPPAVKGTASAPSAVPPRLVEPAPSIAPLPRKTAPPARNDTELQAELRRAQWERDDARAQLAAALVRERALEARLAALSAPAGAAAAASPAAGVFKTLSTSPQP